MADHRPFVCRCPVGTVTFLAEAVPCGTRATQEDGLCDVCSGRAASAGKPAGQTCQEWYEARDGQDAGEAAW